MNTVDTKEKWIHAVITSFRYSGKIRCKEIELMISLGTKNKLTEVYIWINAPMLEAIHMPLEKEWMKTSKSFDEFMKDELKDYL